MKMKLLILLFVCILIPTVHAFKTNTTTFDSLFYFGSGGYAEPTATFDVGTGIGQTTIGEISTGSFNHAVQYGIFWVNVTYTIPSALTLPIGITIEDFGIEWVKLNWT